MRFFSRYSVLLMTKRLVHSLGSFYMSFHQLPNFSSIWEKDENLAVVRAINTFKNFVGFVSLPVLAWGSKNFCSSTDTAKVIFCSAYLYFHKIFYLIPIYCSSKKPGQTVFFLFLVQVLFVLEKKFATYLNFTEWGPQFPGCMATKTSFPQAVSQTASPSSDVCKHHPCLKSLTRHRQWICKNKLFVKVWTSQCSS